MGRDPFAPETPDLQAVLDALDDPDCRAIVRALGDPMTATELSEVCDIPQSTCYRKLDVLTDASLLEEQVEIRADGKHTTRYGIAFEAVRIALDEDRSLDLRIERRSATPDRQLSSLWSEVRKET